MRWLFATLAAISIAVTCVLVANAVGASRELAALDCHDYEGMTILTVLLTPEHPCLDRKNELALTKLRREIEAAVAGIVTTGLVVVAVTRRGRDSGLPPDSGFPTT